MSNRFTAQEQESLFSADAARRAIEQEFVARLFAHLRVTSKGSPAGRLRKIVDALDSGQADRVIEQLAPNMASAAPQRFDDVPEFDYDVWRQRHG
jgi:hypothetical protein